MIERKFRINPFTFIRIYGNLLYLENQVSHTRAFLRMDEYGELSRITYDSVENVDDFCKKCKNKEQAYEIVNRMNRAWLIDIYGETEAFERKFSYSKKLYIEEVIGNIPEIGEANSQGPILRNLQIELTDACNERCIHCYLPNSKKDGSTTLSMEDTIAILKQYHEMGGLKVVFSGGEILLHKKLFQIIDECKELNLMILLQTNLLVLTKEHLQKLKQCEVFNIQVSLYSTDELIHDSITGRKGSFKKTKQNIELLVENDIPVMISCPVMKENFITVRELKEYADTLNVDIYFDYVMMAECDGSDDNLKHRLSEEQTSQILRFQMESNPAFIRAIKESNTLNEALSKKYARRKTMCSIMSASLCIDSDGTIYPCPGWNGMKLGNIQDNSILDVWHGKTADELRNINDNDYSLCKDCSLQNFCDMCAVYNYNENGSLFNVCSRFCENAQTLKKIVTDLYFETHKKL